MKAEELFKLIDPEVSAPVQDAGDGPDRPLLFDKSAEGIIRKTIIRSVPDPELTEALQEIGDNDEYAFSDTYWNIRRIAEYERQNRTPEAVHRNEPFSTLMQQYLDKRSGLVGYARTQIKARYPYQDFKVQGKILSAFLASGKTDCIWACRNLQTNWIPELSDAVRAAWEKYHDYSIGRTVLECLPHGYSITQIDELRKCGISAGLVCATLGDEPDFPVEISFDSLGCTDYLYAMAKLGRSVDAAETRGRIMRHVVKNCRYFEENMFFENVSRYDWNGHWDLLAIPGMGLIVWSLGRLGQIGILNELLVLVKKVGNAGPFKTEMDYYKALADEIEFGAMVDVLDTEAPEADTDGFQEEKFIKMLADPDIPADAKQLVFDLNLTTETPRK